MRRLTLLLLLPVLALAYYDMQWFDLNHWSSPVENWGCWGHDPTQGSGVAGGSWPQPLHNCYVFGAGCWVGSIIGSDTLVTVGYDPSTGGSEMCPTLCRYWRDGTGNMRDRVYKYPGDWPPSRSRFPMAPLWQLSDMDLWCCFCDSNPANHISPGRPLGIDVYLTVYGFADSLAQDFFFLKYELANSSGDSIRQTFFGPVLDPDIGSATDDMTGLILDHLFQVGPDTFRVTNTGFAYDYDNVENPGRDWQSGTPGAVAAMLLDAPGSLGLTAFKKFSFGTGPETDAAQYLSLAGYNYQTGAYEPYDSIDASPGDKQMLLSTGPFDIAPNSVLTFWYAIIGSPFGDSGQVPSERDTSELALRCKRAHDYYLERLTGVAEQPPTPRNVQPFATIVRGVLFLEDCPRTGTVPSVLLDATGRKVLDLVPGANDLRRLAPGVYFVRQVSGVEREASAVAKVIVTR